MDGNELADPARRRGAGVGRGLDRGHVPAHDCGHISGADLLPSDERDLRGLDHCVRRLDHRHEAFRLDHAERLTHVLLLGIYFRCLTASSIRAVSSRYVSRISSSAPIGIGRPGTSRSPGADGGAKTTWQSADSPAEPRTGSSQIGAGDEMPYRPRSPCSRSTSSCDSSGSPPSMRATKLMFAKCSIVSIL